MQDPRCKHEYLNEFQKKTPGNAADDDESDKNLEARETKSL